MTSTGARKDAAEWRGKFPRSFLIRASCRVAGSLQRATAAFHPLASSCSSTSCSLWYGPPSWGVVGTMVFMFDELRILIG